MSCMPDSFTIGKAEIIDECTHCCVNEMETETHDANCASVEPFYFILFLKVIVSKHRYKLTLGEVYENTL